MAKSTSVPSDVFQAGVGDDARVATTQYDWSTPMPVADVEEHAFEAPLGEDFRARRVELDGSKGATYAFEAIEGEAAPILKSIDASAKQRGHLTRFTVGAAPRTIDEDTISAVTEHVQDPYVDHEDAHPEREMLGRMPISLRNPDGPVKRAHIHSTEACEELRCGISDTGFYETDVNIGAWPPAHIEWCVDCLDALGVEPVVDEADDPTPREVVSESRLPARVSLPDILEAVEKAETLLDVQQTLSLQRSIAKSTLRDLGLLGTNASLPTGDELGDRLAALRNGEVPPEFVGGESVISSARAASKESDRPEGDDTWRQYQQRGETA